MFQSKVSAKLIQQQTEFCQLRAQNNRIRAGFQHESNLVINKKDKKMQKMKNKDDEQQKKQTNIQKNAQNGKRKSQDKNDLKTRASHQQQKLAEPSCSQVVHRKICFSQMLKLPNFVLPSKGNVISGYFGHSSVCFKRPIIEGSFYMELKILEDSDEPKMVAYPSSIRLGVCTPTYSMSLPLGGKNSYGWKFSDGKVLSDNALIQKIESCDRSDIIGLGVKMYPPYKHPEKGSKLLRGLIYFYKNGKLLLETEIKSHDEYCVCVSVFNYAKIKLIYEKDQINFLPKQFQPLGDYFQECAENNSVTKDKQKMAE